MNFLVRVGVMGHVGRFRPAEGLLPSRGDRVVVRTERGLEIGEVLTADDSPREADGPLLRRVTQQDAMLAERLDRNRDAAHQECVRLLAERGSASVLLDVEHLFDGRRLYFYYLGDPDPTAEAISAELSAAYDSKAGFAEFATTLAEGCGPGCGTESAENGCGTAGGCSTCAVASACGSSRG
ncbi:PSP1 C-terminal domain-containing protein [Botrimarina sp.]|uniref:PSP1 C-terminal domain-containing protein n=1 Tax=Botrimarina sp. TaxID=2795802 RepID=UPI0032EDA887